MDKQLEKRWDEAIAYARMMLEEYKAIPSGMFGAAMISQSIQLYEDGDRSIQLLEDLEGIS